MHLSKEKIQKNEKEIVELLQSTHRPNIDKVIDYLYETHFFVNPSSATHHHNWVGGLAQHSLETYHYALSNSHCLPPDSVIICALLHDLCKAGKFYVSLQGQIHDRFPHQRHSSLSVKRLKDLEFVLTEDERRAIRWHMTGLHSNQKHPDFLIAQKSQLWWTIYHADKKSAHNNSQHILEK